MRPSRSFAVLPFAGPGFRALGPSVGVALAAGIGIVLAPAPAAAQGATSGYTVTQQARPTVALERRDRGWMGISVDISVTNDGTRPGETIIQVLRTVEGSPAWNAGIARGDVIEGIGREPLTLPGWEELTRNLTTGDEVRLRLRKGDNELRDVRLTAEGRPELALPSDVSDHLEAVRESFEARLESARRVWASPDHVKVLIAGDSLAEASNRILDQARRNAVAFGFLDPNREILAILAGQARRLSAAPMVTVRPITAGLVGRSFVGGAQLSDLNPRLAEYFGTDRGVLVIDVLGDTPAFRAGLVPGDIVVKVGNTDVASLVAFREALAAVRGRGAALSLIRKGEALVVTLSR